MSTLQELERQLGPQIRIAIEEMLAGPDTQPDVDRREVAAADVRRLGQVSIHSVTGVEATRRRRGLAAVVAAIAVFGPLALIWTRGSDTSLQTDSGPSTAGPEHDVATAPTDGSVPVAPGGELSWVQSSDVGSLGRSSVTGIVAGPGGFVATGMGFDGQRNQGRVWFSTDGLSWTEPALDLFDALVVSRPVATSTAFYVAAATNADRTPQDEGEGQPSLADAFLYRSVDGVSWERWGAPLGELPVGLAGVGDGLLRTAWSPDRDELVPWWSADGASWSRAQFSDERVGLPLDRNAVTVDGIHYVGGRRSTARQAGLDIWSSRDGSIWERLPSPPAEGALTAAAGDLVLVTDPPAQATYRYDLARQQWIEVASGNDGAPSTPATPVPVGDLLVAPTVAADGSMTVWTTSTTDIAWRPEPASTIQPDSVAGGQPQSVAVAASPDRVVIASTTPSVPVETVIQVGTAAQPSSSDGEPAVSDTPAPVSDAEVPPLWNLELGPIGIRWEWPPDREYQPPTAIAANTDLPRPIFENGGISVEIDEIVLLDSRLPGSPGEQCRTIIERGLWNQGAEATRRDTTCMIISFWMSAASTTPASPHDPAKMQKLRSYDSILVMLTPTLSYDASYGPRIEVPGESTFHFQEYIDAGPGALVGFDLGSKALGFITYEYEVPPLDQFQPIELQW